MHSLRRGAGEIFGHFPNSSSSETASPHGSRSRRRRGRAPLQSLSESSGFEILDFEASEFESAASNGERRGGGAATDDEEVLELGDNGEQFEEEEDPEALEFAILEAAAEAEERAAAAASREISGSGGDGERKRSQLGDVCPVPPLGAW